MNGTVLAPAVTCCCSSFFSPFLLVVLIASCPTQHTQKPQHKTNTNYVSQSQSFLLSLLRRFSFSFYFTSLVSHSRTTTPSCYHAASVRSHLPSFILPLCAYTLYSVFITGNPRGRFYDTDLIGSAHVYKSALLLVEEGINSNQF